MKPHPASLLSCLCFISTSAVTAEEDWKPVEGHLLTRWAKDVRPEAPLPEYPRPQLVRPDWQNLNGIWEYAITPAAEKAMPESAEAQILVPFGLESALSGVKKPLPKDHALWYRRTFEVPDAWGGRRVLLHFGAVDWHAQVWVNGKMLGEHRGGYTPFALDVTEALVAGKPQLLEVRVLDPTDDNWQPRGKQVRKPEGIWYTAVSGIWQTVWLEPVPASHIRGLRMVPDVKRSAIVVTPDVAGDKPVHFEVYDGATKIAEAELTPGRPTSIGIPQPRLWSPKSPHLYRVKARMVEDAGSGDEVEAYFGMREITLDQVDGHTRILLNGEALFQYGPLDQGWWPDGLYTAPTDAALVSDLIVLKKLGMNMLRKHVKVEPDRYYYHCDRLGLLVWQDMPSGDKYIGGDDPDITRSDESAKNFEAELAAMIDALRNHPSIVMWVVYNEGWGQWDTARLTKWTAEYDPSRLVNAASGWTDRGVGDVTDLHAYPGPDMRPAEPKRASVLGEFGGLGWPVAGHLWQDKQNWGYRTYSSQEELEANYLRLVRQLPLLIGKGLSAAVYTQTTDVEGEVNGLLTYDRGMLKVEPDAVAEAHRHLYEPPPQLKECLPTSQQTPQTWRYTTQQPAENWYEPEFDDSSWPTGEGMFGTRGTPGVRLGTEWSSPEIWLRRTFEITEAPQGELRLNLYHDEDAEVYLNGVLAARSTGYVTAHAVVEMAPEARASLQTGKNTLAVRCKQTGGGQGIDVGLLELIPAGK